MSTFLQNTVEYVREVKLSDNLLKFENYGSNNFFVNSIMISLTLSLAIHGFTHLYL